VSATVTGASGLEPDRRATAAAFETFVARHGPDLRVALTARFGAEVGAEVMADVVALAWERWASVCAMENPAGYLFRAGQSAARRYRRRPVQLGVVPSQEPPEFDPRLPRILEQLPDRQRVAVVLVCVYDWTAPAAAAVLGISESAVRTHVRRGLAALRRELGARDK
jgi:DNA-directed RNA polymerase specialized sigma24 family protein